MTPALMQNFEANGIAVISNALAPASMSRLHRWMTESTIWHYVDSRGYLTANFLHVSVHARL